jgi:response regulator RpfG family c-di-GMP phosphodiesterase
MRDTPASILRAATLSNRLIGVYDVPRVLIVDDEETIRLALAKFLRTRGFDVEAAGSGPDALGALQERRFDVMLCDVRMPEMSGIEVVPQALAIDADLAIVMLTAVNDAPTASEVLARGALDYLMKPIELADLQQAVERVLHRRKLIIEQRNVERLIREEVAVRTAQLEREQAAQRRRAVDVIAALIALGESRREWMRGRSERVADLAAAIAEGMELDAESIEDVRVAARLHDVGYIGLDDAVLDKPAPLTASEVEHVREHVRLGLDALAPLRFLGLALIYVHDHHEHWDGGGYPRGLVGEAISLGGRILCAADAFDALTSARPYRDAMSPEDTLAYLASHAGTLLDPAVYDALARVRGPRTESRT